MAYQTGDTISCVMPSCAALRNRSALEDVWHSESPWIRSFAGIADGLPTVCVDEFYVATSRATTEVAHAFRGLFSNSDGAI